MNEAEVEEVIVMGTVADCVETVDCTEPSVRCQGRDGDTLATGTLPVVTPPTTTTPTTATAAPRPASNRGQYCYQKGINILLISLYH